MKNNPVTLKKQPSLFFSAIGLSILIMWLALGYLFASPLFSDKGLVVFSQATAQFFKFFVNWKGYTLLSFLLGLTLHKHIKLGNSVLKYSLPIVIITTIILSLFNQSTLFTKPSFYEFFYIAPNLSNFNSLLTAPSTLIGLSFGLAVIMLGYLSGKTNWLTEYHFHYVQLKKLFKYSLGLVILWIILNVFGAYLLISKWQLGEAFFILDGLAINVVIVFMYLFLLIYLENFRSGKLILKILAEFGRFWILHIIILTLFIVLLDFIKK